MTKEGLKKKKKQRIENRLFRFYQGWGVERAINWTGKNSSISGWGVELCPLRFSLKLSVTWLLAWLAKKDGEGHVRATTDVSKLLGWAKKSEPQFENRPNYMARHFGPNLCYAIGRPNSFRLLLHTTCCGPLLCSAWTWGGSNNMAHIHRPSQ